MVDTELVIKIDEKLYKDIYSDAEIMIYGGMRSGKTLLATLLRAIRNGTPLPKGHGKLGDLDIILNKARKHRENYMEAENSSYCRGKLHAYELYVEEVENASTIIEADKS